jgi:hypothetical protein
MKNYKLYLDSGNINRKLGHQTRYVYTSLTNVTVHCAIGSYAENEIYANFTKEIQDILGLKDLTNQV